MAIYALIGGRSTENIGQPLLEKQIFSYTNKICPKVLYLPFAAKDRIASYEKFKMHISSLNVESECVLNFDEFDLRTKMQWADVFYFGGGCCEDLVNSVNNSIILLLLEEYRCSSKVFCGISAGAMLWCKFGMGDRNTYVNAYHVYHYSMVQCLGFLPITLCPHYNHDGLWIFNDEVKKYPFDGYALEDDTALVILDTRIIPLKQKKNHSIYYFKKEQEYQMIPLYEETIDEKIGSFRSERDIF